MDRKIWINGSYVDWKDATVHILSHSHQRGSLIFGFMPIFYNNDAAYAFRLDEHVERLFKSCELAGIPLDYSKDEIQSAIKDTIKNNPGSKFIKISVYIASIEIDVVPQDPFTTVAIAAYEPQEDIISKNTQPFHGVKELSVWVEKAKKQRRKDIISPQVKIAANYSSSMMAKWDARKNGYDEIFFVDEENYLTEAPTSNIFIINSEGVLKTCHEDYVLHGITRKSIIDIVKDEGMEIEIGRIPLKELEEAKEVFVTSSSHLVCPVIKVDGKNVGNGEVGEITKKLRKRFQDITATKDNKFQSWLFRV